MAQLIDICFFYSICLGRTRQDKSRGEGGGKKTLDAKMFTDCAGFFDVHRIHTSSFLLYPAFTKLIWSACFDLNERLALTFTIWSPRYKNIPWRYCHVKMRNKYRAHSSRHTFKYLLSSFYIWNIPPERRAVIVSSRSIIWESKQKKVGVSLFGTSSFSGIWSHGGNPSYRLAVSHYLVLWIISKAKKR